MTKIARAPKRPAEIAPASQDWIRLGPPAPAAAAPTEGDDILVGTEGGDTILALGGDDSISGLGGDDILDGGAGDDLVDGGADDDLLTVSGIGADIYHGGSGTDTLSIDYSDAVSPISISDAAPNPGTDGFTGAVATQSGDRGVSFDGIERIQLLTGAADDIVHTLAGQADIRTGGGDDEILTGGGDDFLDGGEGDDWLRGAGGNDVLIGGPGDDLLEGGTGRDELIETAGGNDEMRGGDGDDQLYYSGALSDEAATVLMDGGIGDDFFNYNAFGLDDMASLAGGDGNDVFIVTGGGDIAIDAGAGADYVELVNLGTRYAVTLGAGRDLLALRAFDVEGPQFAAVTVSDFAVGDGGDALGLDQLLAVLLVGWDREANPFASGHLSLIQSGADALLRIDLDGAGDAYGFADLVVLQNVAAASLTSRNLGGWAADGSSTAGQAISGSPADEILTGTSGDDLIAGLGGDDALHGASGDDTLEGGDGDDLLDGALGDDRLFGGAGNDRLIDPLGGSDQLFGEAGMDWITVDRQFAPAASAALLLDGGADVDNLLYYGRIDGDDVTLIGGAGGDSITAFHGGAMTIDAGDGADFIVIDVRATSYAITFGASAMDSDILELGDTFGPVTLFAILDFTAGNSGDIIRMQSFLDSYAAEWDPAANPFATGFLGLAQRGADALILIDRDGGGDGFAVLGILENVSAAALTEVNLGFVPGEIEIHGTGGDDYLIGTAGGDRMFGFAGNDTYVVDNAADVVNEAAGGGIDIVYALTSYALAAGSEIETLSAFSIGWTSALNLTGNEFSNVIVGTYGANTLYGGAGGADSLYGYRGDDTYIVDSDDAVYDDEAVGGYDIVYALGNYTLGAGQRIETLSAFSIGWTSALNLTGNEFSNVIVGTYGANTLYGGAGGADVLYGYRGDDTYIVDSNDLVFDDEAIGGNDIVYALANYTLGAGQRIETLSAFSIGWTSALNLTGNEFSNVIVGTYGANTLYGGAGGADVLVGYRGNDTYIVDADDAVFDDEAIGGNDIVYALANYTLGAGQRIETLSAFSIGWTSALNLTGNEFSNVIVGTYGANTLYGGAGGADVLYGYRGDDTYIVDSDDAVYDDEAVGGYDIVYALANYTLGAGQFIEMLSAFSIASTSALDLTGNEVGNVIVGNAGANAIDGRQGNDYLVAFAGADIFAFTTALNAATNVDVIEGFQSGTDRIALDDAVFAGLSLGALSAGAFVIGTAAADADDRIVYDQATGRLFFDADGSGAGAAVQFVVLSGAPLVTASDFTVI